MNKHSADEVDGAAKQCALGGHLIAADMLHAYAATLRHQAARVDEEMVERAFKAWDAAYAANSRDAIRAALEAALSAQPAGCEVCGGDCAGANPPVMHCPMQAQPAERQGEAFPLVDCIGLALDLEQQAARVESQTVERAMIAAATGLRRLAHTAAPVGVPDDGCYYLQDSRSYVGNCPLWWGKNGDGYVTRLDEAHRYTRDAAMKQHRMRSTDVPWPCAEIDALRRPTVDAQHMRPVAQQIAMLSAAPPAPHGAQGGA